MFDLEQCREEIERLLPEATRVRDVDWHITGDEEKGWNEPDYYVELSDGIALAVCHNVAVTCLTRGGSGSAFREFKKHQRQKKVRHRQESWMHKHGREAHRKRVAGRREWE